MAHIKERNSSDSVSGFAARNQMYYDFMTTPGVKDPKRNYTSAPEYIRAGAKAAFTYGEHNTPEDIIPEAHVEAYNGGKGIFDDADLQAIMDIVVASVQPTV